MRQWIMLGISLIGTLSVVTSNPIRKRASAFDSLVVFGDSYSDNGSLDEFYSDPTLPVPNR
jgi:phospholipase/lecithinase/hemolysin